METVRDLILRGSKITADGDCSDEIKRHLDFGRNAMTNLDSLLKSTDIALLTKSRLSFFVIAAFALVSYIRRHSVPVQSLSCVRLFVTP